MTEATIANPKKVRRGKRGGWRAQGLPGPEVATPPPPPRKVWDRDSRRDERSGPTFVDPNGLPPPGSVLPPGWRIGRR